MERIEDVLHRIQDIIKGQHPKSNIDVDLMLDYTRVLYADLLEWKRKFTVPEESQSSETEKEKDVNLEEAEKENTSEFNSFTDKVQKKENTEEDVQTSENSDFGSDEIDHEAMEINSNDGTLSSEKRSEIEEEKEVKNHEDKKSGSDQNEGKENKSIPPNQDKKEDLAMVNPEDFAEKPNYDSVEKPMVAEQTPDDFIYRDRTVLSFELPKDDCVENETKQKSGKTEPSTFSEQKENGSDELPPQSKDAEESSKESTKLPEFEFKDPALSFIPKEKKGLDIRRVIGLNDRYLFLNELFQQNKPKYEESMDSFNEMDSFEDAVTLAEDLGKEFQWRKDDETVQSFYTILSKHFDAK